MYLNSHSMGREESTHDGELPWMGHPGLKELKGGAVAADEGEEFVAGLELGFEDAEHG